MANGFDPDKARADFLIAMYNQMMNDINRHIVVMWQSLAALFSTFAAWSLIEKQVLSLDWAVSLVLLVAIWSLAHVYDAAYWYNRNLVIIANIERQFLKSSDLREVHYYWGAHRSKSSMLTHLQIQRLLIVGIALLVLAIHSVKVMLPLGLACFSGATIENFLPAAMALFACATWVYFRNRGIKRYEEFLKNSPGKDVDTSGISFGTGHPIDQSDAR